MEQLIYCVISVDVFYHYFVIKWFDAFKNDFHHSSLRIRQVNTRTKNYYRRPSFGQQCNLLNVIFIIIIVFWTVNASSSSTSGLSTSDQNFLFKVTINDDHGNLPTNTKTNGFIIVEHFDVDQLANKSIVGYFDLDTNSVWWKNMTTKEIAMMLGFSNNQSLNGAVGSWNSPSSEHSYHNSDSFNNYSMDSFAILNFWPGQFILITLYSVAAFLSLTLNIVTIIVWFYGERTQSTELWHLLVNLSMADIGMAIFCIPFTYTNVMLQQWIFPHSLCPVVNFAQLCFIFVSVWILTIISIDRYFAIVHPLYKFRCSKRSILVTVWILGILFASSQLFVSSATPYTLFEQTKLYECIEVWSSELYGQIYTVMVFVVTFLIPVMIITLAYSTIWYHIAHHETPGNPDIVRDTHQMDVKNKVIKMLTMVVGLFIVCWLPIHFFNLLIYFAPSIMNIETELMHHVYYSSFFVSHFLSMVHSLMNPIVYCFMSENFRHNLLSLFSRYINRFKQQQCDLDSMDHIEMGGGCHPATTIGNDCGRNFNSGNNRNLTIYGMHQTKDLRTPSTLTTSTTTKRTKTSSSGSSYRDDDYYEEEITMATPIDSQPGQSTKTMLTMDNMKTSQDSPTLHLSQLGSFEIRIEK